jgi:hypothetical protein
MSQLSDFGGGVDEDEVNPEDEVKQYLSEWLRGDDRTIYWERDKTYGNGTFSVSTRRRPDLLIKSKVNNFAVEVKIGEDSSNVHDGCYQTYEYWRDIVEGRASYTVRGEEVTIDAVLLATRYSPEGHLFHSWENKDVMRTGRSDGAMRAVELGQIPEIEYGCTESAIRLMHRFARGYDDNAAVGIGGLLSSALDGDQPNITAADPAALYYALGTDHVQNWEYIPFYKGE